MLKELYPQTIWHATTPINVDKLESDLQGHPDQDFVHFLISGLKHGFDTGLSDMPTTSLECQNLKSARSDPIFVSAALQQEVAKGYMIGPFSSSPYSVYRVSPLGVAEHKYSKKKRLIVDLSAPHESSEHPSINDFINKEDYSLSYVRIDDAIALLKKLGHKSEMCKTDITDAFRLIPIKTSLWRLYGVKWENKYYFSCRLAMGSRSSPFLFDQLSKAICWIATNKYQISHILHLLDDFLTADSPQNIAERTMALLSMLFRTLGIPTAPHKTMGPSPIMEFLGIVLDSVRMEARLPQDKLDRIVKTLNYFCTRCSCTKQELLSLLGHLNYACRVVVPGRSFISYLIQLSTTVQGLFDTVYITKACQAEFKMWFNFLKSWNGIYFFLEDNITTCADLHLFTDASGKGFGGFYQNRWFQGHWPPDFPKITTTAANMALLELYPIVVAAVLWGREWCKKRILFHCDNLATVYILKKGRSPNQHIMCLMRTLTLCAAQYNFTVHAAHVFSKVNYIADSISRFQDLSKFPQLAPKPCPVPPMSEIMFY